MIQITNYEGSDTVEHVFLAIPNESHEKAYTEMMDRWEKIETKINPSLLGRYSEKEKRNVSYSKWLEWWKDQHTTGSMLSTKVPCTLYFLMNNSGEILGSIEINHANTHRGHLHAGIAPWNRNKGYGSVMLKLALDKCRKMQFSRVEICPYKNNIGAIKTIVNNGGILIEEFFENGLDCQRYLIEL